MGHETPLARASAPEVPQPPATQASFSIKPLKHPFRVALTVLLALFLAQAVVSVLRNENFRWNIVAEYLFSPQILAGLSHTVLITVISMIVGLTLGAMLAIMRLSEARLFRMLSSAYIWFFRGTPVLVQLIFWYNFGALYETISVGLPFLPALATFTTNEVITPWTAAILGLGLNQAAYTAEVIRGGILAVGSGQREAAKAIGMGPAQIYRRIIMPQAMPVIIPPVGNEIISMLKNSSLVSVIAMVELLHSAQLIYARTYETIPLLIVACCWYLVATTILSLLQSRVERYYSQR